MPEATPFQTLGWFPFCLEKVDVSGYDYWSTLGGVTKDNPTVTQEKIGISAQNGTNFYWNLYGVTGTFTKNGVVTEETINVDDNLVEGTAVLPIDRLCPDASDFYGVTIFKLTSATATTLSASTYGLEGSASDPAGHLVRMYNGAVTDEDNFVGYGLSVNLSTFPAGSAQPGLYYSFADGPEGEISICSFANTKTPSSNEDYDFAYTTINGIPVLAAVYAFGDNPVADAFNRSSSFDDTVAGDTYNITLDSIEFYTYPS